MEQIPKALKKPTADVWFFIVPGLPPDSGVLENCTINH